MPHNVRFTMTDERVSLCSTQISAKNPHQSLDRKRERERERERRIFHHLSRLSLVGVLGEFRKCCALWGDELGYITPLTKLRSLPVCQFTKQNVWDVKLILRLCARFTTMRNVTSFISACEASETKGLRREACEERWGWQRNIWESHKDSDIRNISKTCQHDPLAQLCDEIICWSLWSLRC